MQRRAFVVPSRPIDGDCSGVPWVAPTLAVPWHSAQPFDRRRQEGGFRALWTRPRQKAIQLPQPQIAVSPHDLGNPRNTSSTQRTLFPRRKYYNLRTLGAIAERSRDEARTNIFQILRRTT